MKQRLAFCALILLVFVLAWPGIADSVGRILNLTDQGEARFYEARAGGSNYIALKAAAALAGNVSFALPTTDGTTGQFLKTDGSAALSWGNNSTATLDSAYNNGISITVDAGAVALAGSGTLLDVQGGITIDGPTPWVDVSGYGTNSAAFDTALAVISGGGVLFVPAGSYTLATQVSVGGSDITIMGVGADSVINSGAAVDLLHATGRSRIAFKNLRFVLTHSGARAISLDGGASGTTTDWTIQGVDVAASAAGCHGFRMVSDLGTATVNRVLVTDCRLINTAATPTGQGIGIGGGLNTLGEAFVDNCYVEGFKHGFEASNNGTGDLLTNLNISNCIFKDNFQMGARFYHAGQSTITSCLFVGNEVGAFLDAGSSDERTAVVGCRFLDNDVLGAFTEEWKTGTITGCVFAGNGEAGLWLQSVQEVSVVGCTISDNTKIGLLTDKDSSFVGPNSGVTYVSSHVAPVRDTTITGCVISKNGEHGLTLEGTARTVIVSGCEITRNGTSSGGLAESSGYADIFIDDSGAGSANATILIQGCSFGNPAGGGEADDGKTQYGIYVPVGGRYSFLGVKDCHFESVNDALQLDQVNSMKVVTGCTFFACKDISLSTGKVVFWGNTIDAGDLDGSSWDGYWSVGSTQGNVEFQEAVDLESTITVDGTSTLTGAVTASAALSVGTTLTVTGAATVGTTLGVTGVTTTTGQLVAGTMVNLTEAASTDIAAGQLTMTAAFMVVGAQSDTSPVDTLDVITTSPEISGDVIILEADTGDTITVDETGNIDLGASTRVLDSVEDKLILLYNGTSFCEISFADNG